MWREENWSKVHVSVESKFNLFGSYWENIFGVKLNPKCVKYRGLRDVFCSRSWASYTAACQVNPNVYQNLLQQHAVPSLQASPNLPAIFMQDNAPVTLQNG